MPYDYDFDEDNSGKTKPYTTKLSPATLGMPQSGESMSENEKGRQQYVNLLTKHFQTIKTETKL